MGERLAGRVAVVIGAASGIGAARARRFTEEGATDRAEWDRRFLSPEHEAALLGGLTE